MGARTGDPDHIERTHINRIRRLAAGAALIAIVISGCSNADARPSWTYAPPPPDGAAAAPGDGAAASAPAAAAPADTITIEAFDLGFKPAAVSVPAAGTYDVDVQQHGRDAP